MPQLRKDPVTREWVVIATERSRRPSDFRGGEDLQAKPSFSPNCPFCPGNEAMTPPELLSYRPADTLPNGAGWWIRVVPNKFPALAIEGDLDRVGYGMYDMMNGIGAHEVIIETPEHDKSPATMPHIQLQEVLWAYRDRFLDLQQDRRFKYILVFRNHGKIAGASLEHPHSQLIALPMVPQDVMLKIEGAQRYYDYHERCIYTDMIKQEMNYGERVVCMTDEFIAFCPFAAKSPFETWVMPRHHSPSFAYEDRSRINSFAVILQDVLERIRVCLNDTPYNYMLHTAPINQDRERDFHWHLRIVPRLTIAAGFELGTGIYINVTSPEDAARHLRSASVAPPATDGVHAKAEAATR